MTTPLMINDVFTVMQLTDRHGLLMPFLHFTPNDKYELDGFETNIIITETDSVYMFPVQFGIPRHDQVLDILYSTTAVITVLKDQIILNIGLTPKQYYEFRSRVNVAYSNSGPNIELINKMERLINYFYNNILVFVFDKDLFF